MQPSKSLENSNARLRLVEEADAGFIAELRLNQELTRHISAVTGGTAEQEVWIRKYKEREREGREFYFIIESLQGEPLGTVRIYDIRGESFCWGSWIVKPGAPPQTAISSAILLYEFAFEDLGFARSHFDVRKTNQKVLDFHRRMGAIETHESATDFFFDYPREKFEEARLKFSKFSRSKDPKK